MTAGRGYVRNVGRGYVINEWQRLCNDKGGHRAARAAKKCFLHQKLFGFGRNFALKPA